jgi:hypothetical protein
MPTSRITGYPGLAIHYDSGKNPFFEVVVTGSLSTLRKYDTGKAIFAAIAGVNPTVKGSGVNGFAAGAKVTIHPLVKKVDFMMKGYQHSTNTSSEGLNQFNTIQNAILRERWKTEERIRGGDGNSHVALSYEAAENGSGTVAKVYFTNAIRKMQSGLVSPPFVALAHELIHAIHSLKGEKEAVIANEEARTVGLGQYANERISENALRAEAGLALRTVY